MSISKTGVALVVLTLGYFGVDVTDNMVLEVAGAAIQVISFIYLVWKQIKRPETFGFLLKKW